MLALASTISRSNQTYRETLPVNPTIGRPTILLAACLDYHRACKGSLYEGVEARYLFDSMAEAFDDEAAVKAKYTHLIGDAKSNATLARSLENRVAREYPKAFERCCVLRASRQLVAASA